jgi:hypothetical protein
LFKRTLRSCWRSASVCISRSRRWRCAINWPSWHGPPHDPNARLSVGACGSCCQWCGRAGRKPSRSYNQARSDAGADKDGGTTCAIMPRRLSPEERMRSSPTVFNPRPLQ